MTVRATASSTWWTERSRSSATWTSLPYSRTTRKPRALARPPSAFSLTRCAAPASSTICSSRLRSTLCSYRPTTLYRATRTSSAARMSTRRSSSFTDTCALTRICRAPTWAALIQPPTRLRPHRPTLIWRTLRRQTAILNSFAEMRSDKISRSPKTHVSSSSFSLHEWICTFGMNLY